MKKENIKIYLLDSLNMIIGEDFDNAVGSACKVVITPQGPAIGSFYIGINEDNDFCVDIDKTKITILSAKTPRPMIVEAYLKIISGEPIHASKIIRPKFNPNLN